MTASLAPLANLTVPAQLGYQVPLNGSGNTDPAQTYTVTSDNPRIAATVATGPYWTLSIQHNASSRPGDISFTGSLTFQLFQDLLGNAPGSTISEIETFTNDGYYNGKDFTRIAADFPGATDYVAQGAPLIPTVQERADNRDRLSPTRSSSNLRSPERSNSPWPTPAPTPMTRSSS